MSNVGEDIGFIKAEIADIKEDLRDLKPVVPKVQRLELIVGAAVALAGFIASQVIGLWADIFGHHP